jgi:hypothetical protein
LRNDGVRVLSRVMRKARQVAADAVGWSQEHLEDAARQAKAGMKRIMDVARQKGEPAADALKTAYQDLVRLSQRRCAVLNNWPMLSRRPTRIWCR